METIPTLELKELPDYHAPDGSEIRKLVRMNHGSMAHCILPVGQTSKAVRHKTVEEMWFVKSGKGKIWRSNGDKKKEPIDLYEGLSIGIATGEKFQFKNTGNIPLKIIICSMPPWPGPDEAERVDGFWG